MRTQDPYRNPKDIECHAMTGFHRCAPIKMLSEALHMHARISVCMYVVVTIYFMYVCSLCMQFLLN